MYPLDNLFYFGLSLLLVLHSANLSVEYASGLAHTFKLPRYAVGFLIIAIISIIPETSISIVSALQGVPSFALGMLFGSNVADLTLIFAIVIARTAGGIKVSARIMENNKWYISLLALPIILGLDGVYSRLDGALLIVSGLFFYARMLKRNHFLRRSTEYIPQRRLTIFNLATSTTVLLIGSYLTVKYGVLFAESIQISPIFIGMLVVGLGTTLPELFFSLHAIKQKTDDLALGDILGTVISDATIVVGILALIHPFAFPPNIVYVTGIFMVFALLILLAFMRSGRILTKIEGIALFLFYLLFVFTEYMVSKW